MPGAEDPRAVPLRYGPAEPCPVGKHFYPRGPRAVGVPCTLHGGPCGPAFGSCRDGVQAQKQVWQREMAEGAPRRREGQAATGGHLCGASALRQRWRRNGRRKGEKKPVGMEKELRLCVTRLTKIWVHLTMLGLEWQKPMAALGRKMVTTQHGIEGLLYSTSFNLGKSL